MPTLDSSLYHPPQNTLFIHKLESWSKPAHLQTCVICTVVDEKKITLLDKFVFGEIQLCKSFPSSKLKGTLVLATDLKHCAKKIQI